MQSEDINQIQTSGQPVVVFFYTPLCGTCKLAGKMLDVADVAMEAEPLDLFQCNLNLNPEAAVRWKIESVPCLLFFKGGKVVDRMYSMTSFDHMYQKLKEFQKNC